MDKLCLINDIFKMDFGCECFIIVVLGLNLYVSDNGLFGDVEEKVICLVVVEVKKSGIMVMGLFFVDGFFGFG